MTQLTNTDLKLTHEQTTLAIQTSEAVNVTRGFMVLLLVFVHWSPGVFERLSWDYLAVTNPLFRIATPGFAIIFGLSMGLYIFQRFKIDTHKTLKRLRKSFLTLASGIIILAAIKYSILLLEGTMSEKNVPSVVFFSVLLYYLLAIASIPVWYYVLNKFNHIIIATLFASAVMYIIGYGVKIILPTSENLEGFMQLGGLMLEAKYNYFDMSAVVFLGIALGLYVKHLLKMEQKGYHLFGVGLLLIIFGVMVSYETDQINLWLTVEMTPIWMDITYLGVVTVILSFALSYSYRVRKALIPKFTFRLTAVLGTLSLFIYIGHGLVIPFKDLLLAMGLHYLPSISISMIIFIIAIWIPAQRRYRKFYQQK